MINDKFRIGDRVTLHCKCHDGEQGVIIGTNQRPIRCWEVQTDTRIIRPCSTEELELAPRGGHPMFYELLEEEGRLNGSKSSDYTKGGDALGNFKRVAAIKKLYPSFPWDTATGTCIDYMLKQLDCALWMLQGKYQGRLEGFKSRMMDVSMYANLSIINEKEEGLCANSKSETR